MKRFLRLIFILFAVSLISFWICSHTNTDPIEQWCMMQQNENEGITDCSMAENTNLKRKEWRLDLPLFYIGFGTWAEPDTLYKISNKNTQKTALIALQKSGKDWAEIQVYFKTIYALQKNFETIKNQHISDSNYFEYASINHEIYTLFQESESPKIIYSLSEIELFYTQNHLSSPHFILLTQQNPFLAEKHFNIKNYLPKISFYGLSNQYHQWLIKVLQGDFGKSYRTNQSVSERIGDFVARSAMFALLSFLLAYLIAIPLGILKTAYQGSLFDKGTDSFIFIINALPTFIVGIFLIIIFANPDIFNWFLPAYSYTGSWFSRATLPLIAYTVGSAATLTALINSLLTTEMQQDYIRTAQAKGLKSTLVYIRHAFKNILIPLLSNSASLLPSLIGGSITLEYVFSIGGMGQEAFIAIQSLDIPMVLAIMTLTGLLTVLGYMITDSLSILIDKRIEK